MRCSRNQWDSKSGPAEHSKHRRGDPVPRWTTYGCGDLMSEISSHIEALRTSGRVCEALRDVCEHADAYAHDYSFLQLAARVIGTAASSNRVSARDWESPIVQSAFRTLARQDACDERPAALAHAVAASAITRGSQSAFASALAPVLAKMVAMNDLNTVGVVTLLTIRERVGSRLRQSAISALHRKWLPRFGWSELALPYNTMFTRESCRRNIDDLRKFVADASYLATNLGVSHRLMLSWVLQEDLPLPTDADSLDDCAGDRRPGASVRYGLALCLRHAEDPRARAMLQRWADREVAVQAIVDSSTAQRFTRTSEERGRPKGWQASLVEKRWWQGVQFVKGKVASALPIRLARSRPRVAICISGQLRGFRQAWPTWQRTLFNGIEATVFVHTWTRIGNSDPSPLRASLPFEGAAFRAAWRTVGTRETAPRMRDRYPSVFKALHNSSVVSESELASLYGAIAVRVEDDSLAPFRAWTNQEKMHYKIEACHRLLADDGDRFDLVVRIRPDLPVRRRAFDWRHLREWCADTPVIFTERGYGQQYGHLMIGDQFAVGNPHSMSIYSKAWSNAPMLFESRALSTTHPFVGHATLAEVCWLSGLDVRRIPLQFGSLLDMEPLSWHLTRRAVEADAADRMDDIDRCLIEAASAP